MRLALFSDIHGNILALEACLDDLRKQGGADVMVGAGDYCVDGPRPLEVLQMLQAWNFVLVRGNTDRVLADVETPAPAFGETADSLAWYRAAIGSAWVDRLRELPFAERFGEGDDRLLVVHANPKTDDEHIWPDAPDDFLERITADVPERTIAFGHLHLPYVRLWRDRLFVDVASAGLPKDGDSRAGYVIMTQRSGGWQVKHRRVRFDVEKVANDLEARKIPGRRKRQTTLRRHRYKVIDERIP